MLLQKANVVGRLREHRALGPFWEENAATGEEVAQLVD